MTYCINYSVWDVSIYCIYIFGPHSQWWKMEALIVLFFLVLIRFPCTRSTTLCRTSTDVIPGSISSPTTHEHVGHFDTALDIKNKLKRRCWTERWIFLVVFSFLAFNLVKCSVKNPQTDELYCCCPCPPGGAQTTQNEALFWKVQRRDLGFHLEVLAKAKNCISQEVKVNCGVLSLNQCPQTPEEMRCQGEVVHLDVQDFHLSLGDLSALIFIFLIGLQIGSQPLQLEAALRIQAVVHLVQTCKFIEVVPNVIGLVIVPSVFVVNKFDMSGPVGILAGHTEQLQPVAIGLCSRWRDLGQTHICHRTHTASLQSGLCVPPPSSFLFCFKKKYSIHRGPCLSPPTNPTPPRAPIGFECPVFPAQVELPLHSDSQKYIK